VSAASSTIDAGVRSDGQTITGTPTIRQIVAKLSATGSICLYTSVSTHRARDTPGYVTEAAAA